MSRSETEKGRTTDLMANLRASLESLPTNRRRRRVPSQCLGCGQFVGPASSAWATGYHPDCEPAVKYGARR